MKDEELVKKWQLVLDSKCLNGVLAGREAPFCRMLEEQFQYREVARKHGEWKGLKLPASLLSLATTTTVLGDLIESKVVVGFKECPNVEYHTMSIGWNSTLMDDLMHVGLNVDSVHDTLLEIINYEISAYYKNLDKFIQLPYAPLVIYDEMDLGFDRLPEGFETYEFGVLKPV